MTTLLDTIQATVWEVTQKQLLAASTIPGPSAPVIQTVPDHPRGPRKLESSGPIGTAGEFGSGTHNEHVGRASSLGMKREKEGYVDPSWRTPEYQSIFKLFDGQVHK